MGRKKKKTFKKRVYPKWYITVDEYKKTVVITHIRFDYKAEDETDTNGLRELIEKMLDKEFEYVKRKRNIFEVSMADYMRQKTARCSISLYFLNFEDSEEYIIRHSEQLMQDIEELFDTKGLELILPQGSRTNNMIDLL